MFSSSDGHDGSDAATIEAPRLGHRLSSLSAIEALSAHTEGWIPLFVAAAAAAHPSLSVYMRPLKPLSLGISLFLVTIEAL
ncbi:hypothetical protein AMTRI_Chr06g195030 [Amborella trichopoda]